MSEGKAKGKLALYWAASCGGCEISLLGIDAKILDVADNFDIVLWPCATDGKVKDIEKMADREIDVCLFNGGIRTSEQEYMARLLRQKSKVLVAFGSCASEGCIPGLGNMNDKESCFKTVYHDSPSLDNPQGIEPQPVTEMPEGKLHLPVYYDTLKTLNQTVPVDYFLPGCPPEADRIWDAIVAILEQKLPAPGATIGSNTTVCDDCPRKREEKKIKKFYRTWEIQPNMEQCLLEQGLLCAGIATRAGCGALCPQVNSPCIGCYGPNNGVEDHGMQLLSAVASVIDSEKPEEINAIIKDGFPDPVGSFYRFGLAQSSLRRRNKI
ncbi:MAG: NADH-quinone oxidoreductase subunit B family protein [Thermoguttaceae bacterium]